MCHADTGDRTVCVYCNYSQKQCVTVCVIAARNNVSLCNCVCKCDQKQCVTVLLCVKLQPETMCHCVTVCEIAARKNVSLCI